MPTAFRAALGCCFGLFTLLFITTVSTNWTLLEEHFFELTSAVVMSSFGICLASPGRRHIRLSVALLLLAYIAFHYILFAFCCLLYYRFDFHAS
jgi:hypothetical protein